MLTGALHVQHKDHDVHDRDNRVLSANVVAVSTDTGDVRFGDGNTAWRDLPNFGGGSDKADSTVEGYTGLGYSGPLHVVVFTDDEIAEKGDAEAKEFVPAANEMVLFGSQGVYFGNGAEALSYLPVLAPADAL